MSVTVSFAGPQHRSSLVETLVELNRHYCGDAGPEAVAAHLEVRLLAPTAPVRLVVAMDPAGRVVGLAAVAHLHSIVDPAPESSGQVLLKELFVREAARGAGVGAALMRWVAAFARDQGCSRVDWNVQAGNALGIAFYQGLGARRVEDRWSFRLDHDAIDALAR